jgi:hypothetical protein
MRYSKQLAAENVEGRFFYFGNRSYFIIISLLMSPLLRHRPSLWITHKENGPSYFMDQKNMWPIALSVLEMSQKSFFHTF